ncbi:unnamed protein product [Acanthoscelides obtectus]|uniref:Uncharacterized protein n=1 Tax=Acanthoscelides obtectus TaxID=200917 RepID=A0A9P0M046_ACAOB|nr:unnamed protein product [Acanthoscelides obtectus]CAK1646494.1 hypothetical protein AOBTE_LOCUS14666 [Acanthoscelides obtectus]
MAKRIKINISLADDCTKARFTPEDENQTLTEYKEFVKLLEEKTFNTILKNLDSCPTSKCEVDPKCEAIWIVRDRLYQKFSAYFKDENDQQKQTLDGCFCNSASREELDECTKKVRGMMTNYLNDKTDGFDKDLAQIINDNECRLFSSCCKKPEM